MSQTDTRISVKQAVNIAKAYVTETFADDNIERVGLEEIAFDDSRDEWLITIGFSRPWDKDSFDAESYSIGGFQLKLRELEQLVKRTYKKVAVSVRDGNVIRVENRPV